LQFYLTDALNSVVNLTNNSGAVQARYQYDAWGNKRNEVGSSWNRFGFTGHEHDEETGLIYAKARFYDPDTGRFLGEDAWEGDVMLPPSLHKYLYAYQNPTVYWDPDGNKSVFGDATKELQKFKAWLGKQNKKSDSKLAAAAIGTAQFVTTLGEGITRPLDIAANVVQEAVGVDDQQVRDELAGTRGAITNGIDFVVNGDYSEAVKNAHSSAVAETVKAFEGDVSAISNVTQGALGTLLMRGGGKPKVGSRTAGTQPGKATVAQESASSAGSTVLQSEAKALQSIKSKSASSKSLDQRINERGVVDAVKQNAKQAAGKTRLERSQGNARLENPSAFGTKAHKHFERENNKLQNRIAGDKRVSVEEFRSSDGALVRRREAGSIGADVIVRSRNSSRVEHLFDLKTYMKSPTKIGSGRQLDFEERFGKKAQEIFIKQ